MEHDRIPESVSVSNIIMVDDLTLTTGSVWGCFPQYG